MPSLRRTIGQIPKNSDDGKIYFRAGAYGRVRDCSEKPTARAGIAGRKGEDL